MIQADPQVFHILVVDDEEAIRETLQAGIEFSGYRCSVASDGLDALDFLAGQSVDVVITDINMPNMGGIELTEIIKRDYEPDVIVMTGFGVDTTYDKIIEKGASDFIQKPVGVREMILRIERLLTERVTQSHRLKAEEELRKSYKRLKQVLDQTVQALASALEKRDPYTAGHQQRVARLAQSIAADMGLPKSQIEGIFIAGLLHDIGKISIPTDILNKPGRLSPNEFNLIKEHSQVGFEILSGIEFDQPIATCVRQHHERINGSGYPQGVSGKELILESRVLAVADVVEAMSSHRPYRPSLGLEPALAEIEKNADRLYDANIVRSCLKIFSSGAFSFEAGVSY